jgi:polar amino acid transport system substrate-binding protein
MFNRWKRLPATLAVLILAAIPYFAEAAEDNLDLRPERSDRIRADRSEAAIDALPRDFKFVKDGSFTVAITPWSPPIATYATDARPVVGFDPDFAQLVADALGKKLELTPIAWADWPLGLASGKYDAVISNVGVTEQRKEKFDFSTYRKGLHGFYVRADSPISSIKEPKDIAGLRIITDSGTIQEKIILEWNKQNVARGLKPVEVQYFDDDAARMIALLSGRADAIFGPNSAQAYQAARQGKTKPVGVVSAGWPLTAEVAIATRKGGGLADALTIAINDLIESGKYGQALARWGLAAEAVEVSVTNPPGPPKF